MPKATRASSILPSILPEYRAGKNCANSRVSLTAGMGFHFKQVNPEILRLSIDCALERAPFP